MAWDKEKRNATQKKYHDATQQKYIVCFHKKKDADCIAFLEKQKKEGITPSQVFKQLLKEKNNI